MKEETGEIVYSRYVGHGAVREDNPKESHVSGWRKSLQKSKSLEILEDIAWM